MKYRLFVGIIGVAFIIDVVDREITKRSRLARLAKTAYI